MTPGVHNLTMAEYQRDPCPAPSLSAGTAHTLITQSPRHAWFAHPRLNPDYQREDDDKFDLGACAHAVLLEGEGSIVAIEAPDWRTKAAKEARDAARADSKIPVLAHKLYDIRTMAAEARKALLALDGLAITLSEGIAERSLIWQEDDLWCRARPDWMANDRKVLLDYKSTAGSAEPSAWIRNQMVPLGNDLQAYHYLRGNAATGGERRARLIFLVQENYAPFECAFVGLSPAMAEIAQRKWDFAFALWQSCMKKNKWSGYSRRIAYAEPMPWEIANDEELRLTFEERLEYATV